ncbi:amino acid ABC transporter permease [Microbacterium saperdae]
MSEDFVEHLGDLGAGLLVSLQLTAVSTAAGLLLGLGLALLVSHPSRWVSWPAVAVVELGRGAPVLVVLQLVYFGLPSTGIVLAAMPAAWIALAFTTGAYSSEIIRASLLAVPKGQREAAAALGLSRGRTFTDVVLPQASLIALAPLLGFCIQMFQATSLAFALGIPELLSRAYDIGSVTFEYLQILMLAGVFYAVVTLPAIRIVARLERRTGTPRIPILPTRRRPTGAS